MSDREQVMKTCVDMYLHIDHVGVEYQKRILEQIQPLLDDGKFDEAKKEVREFYKPARIVEEDGTLGDVIFIEYDLIMAKINRLKK